MMVVHDVDRPDVNGVPPKMLAIADQVRAALSAPFLTVETNDNLCSSVIIRGSFQAKEEWSGGIFYNSPFFMLILTPPGRYYKEGDRITAKLSTNSRQVKKFRAYTGSPENVVAKIKTWLETAFQG